MARHIGIQFFIACAAAIIGCTSEQTVQPIAYNPPPAHAFTALELVPDSLWIPQGAEVQVFAVARDQWGQTMDVAGPVSYASSAPAIAAVNGSGLVTAVAPGTAAVSATVTIGEYTRNAVMTATVFDSAASDTVVFTSSSSYGWQPPSGIVKAGGIVVWRIGPDGLWSGGYSQEAKIYLFDMNGLFLDSLYLNNGSVTHTFAAPGVYQFCSGGCWDPPDGGVIYVH